MLSTLYFFLFIMEIDPPIYCGLNYLLFPYFLVHCKGGNGLCAKEFRLKQRAQAFQGRNSLRNLM